MTIKLIHAGKRFNRDWIFRRMNHHFHAGRSYAITGPNGSGKSTLLQVIAGSMNVSEGECQWSDDHRIQIPEDQVYRRLSIAAPYLEVIEEMTAKEFLSFHASFKPLADSVSLEEILVIVGLEKAAHKQIRYFSSGMKQRIKLAQAIFSDTPLLLLDEPCTNLDSAGYSLYRQLIHDHCRHKLIIVSSNDPQEYDFCDEQLQMADYK